MTFYFVFVGVVSDFLTDQPRFILFLIMLRLMPVCSLHAVMH